MFSFKSPVLGHQFLDSNGEPLSGGLLYTYVAGTTTPAATYNDPTGSAPNANPIVLDASGRASIYISSGNYKFILKDANDVTIDTFDYINIESLAELSSLWTTHAIADGAVPSDLNGETLDFALYSSCIYDVEIKRGSATFAVGQLSIQNVNGIGRVRVGSYIGDNPGITFSVSQVGQIAQLRAQASSGPGAGTIKLSRRIIPA